MLKTNEQIKRMFGLASRPAREAGWEPKEFLEDIASQVSGGLVERLSCLSFDQANAIIHRLGGEPLNPPGSRLTSRRTVNYRRQKGGVPQIATAAQMKFLNDLAAGRGITDAGLKNLCTRMIKKPRPRTSAEANKIIEAIKAMNARDRVRTTSRERVGSSKEAA
ncbi:MAG: hypothetical protein IT174_10630 [Acidobacteria bacterium]|nr:hypothetical protein [Acidobacteriota bacterium]